MNAFEKPVDQTMKDEQLMLLVKDGKINYLGQLFERYNVALFNYFRRMTRREALSEDLTQNVFERVLKHKHTYREEFPFRAWIFQIARNVRMDHYRGEKVKYDANVDPLAMELTDKDTEVNARREDLKEEMERALGQLKDDYREVLILTRYERMKYAQVAESLGISESAVKIRVHRAIKQLSTVYQNLAAL